MTGKSQPGLLTPEVLGNLLGCLGIPVRSNVLTEACSKAQSEAKGPLDHLGRIMASVNRRQARAALLRWDRFDHRHLPVLVWHEGHWLLAETADGGEIRLSNGIGDSRNAVPDTLRDAPVLWIRNTARRTSDRFIAIRSRSMRILLDELLNKKSWLVDVLISTLAVNILGLASSLFSMQVYDRVVPASSYYTLYALTVGMFIAMSCDWLLRFIRSRILDHVAVRVDKRVSTRIFDHMIHLRLDTRPKGVGSLAAQVSGLEMVRSFFASSIVFILLDIPFAVFFIAVIGVIGGPIGWVYLSAFIVAIVFGSMAQYFLADISKKEIHFGHDRQGLLVDTIRGAESILSLGAAWRFVEKWQDMTATIAKYTLKSRLISNVVQITAASFGSVAYVVGISIGVFEIGAGHLTTGGLIACSMLGGRIISPVAQSVQILVQWHHVKESLRCVDGLFDVELDRPCEYLKLLPEQLEDSLEFDRVRFAYPDSPVIKLDIPNLRFKGGDRVVLLGPNGSGKSTLLKAAAGLYRPASGQVRLGGADIWALDPQVVNTCVGYLPQEVHLFKGTLRSNLVIAGAVNDAKLLEVIRQLGIDKIAMDHPRQMEIDISEGGTGLSGGQRQLVAVARIFLSAPRVWILDEPSANLDDSSEVTLLNLLNQYMRPSDILIIATHRPRLVSLANRLVVLQQGQVVADGVPENIMRRLCQNQGINAAMRQ